MKLTSHQYRWLVLAVLFAGLSVWFCYDEGTVERTDRVTITWVTDRNVFVPPSAAIGPRLGATPGGYVHEFSVRCQTVREGTPCKVITNDYTNYQQGSMISAEVELTKPKGEWGWTTLGRWTAYLAALMFAGLMISIRKKMCSECNETRGLPTT